MLIRDSDGECRSLISLVSDHPPTDEDPLHIANVTSSSLRLHWSNPEAKLFVYFEVVLTRLRDHALILKTNVSGTELTVNDLDSSQTYHAVVTARTEDGQIVSTRKGIMTTSESSTIHLQSQRYTLVTAVVYDRT